MLGTKYFLPYLLERPEAAVVNLSSVFGLAGFPEQVPYCTSKFAVRGFSEALRMELADTNLMVHCVHPGGIKTNIVRNARHYSGDIDKMNKIFDEKLAKTSAEDAAKRILKGVKNKEPKILVGLDAEILDRMTRLVPPRFNGWLQRGFEQILLGKQVKDLDI
jgi:butyryl-CoA dehydrogenase